MQQFGQQATHGLDRKGCWHNKRVYAVIFEGSMQSAHKGPLCIGLLHQGDSALIQSSSVEGPCAADQLH